MQDTSTATYFGTQESRQQEQYKPAQSATIRYRASPCYANTEEECLLGHNEDAKKDKAQAVTPCWTWQRSLTEVTLHWRDESPTRDGSALRRPRFGQTKTKDNFLALHNELPASLCRPNQHRQKLHTRTKVTTSFGQHPGGLGPNSSDELISNSNVIADANCSFGERLDRHAFLVDQAKRLGL